MESEARGLSVDQASELMYGMRAKGRIKQEPAEVAVAAELYKCVWQQQEEQQGGWQGGWQQQEMQQGGWQEVQRQGGWQQEQWLSGNVDEQPQKRRCLAEWQDQ